MRSVYHFSYFLLCDALRYRPRSLPSLVHGPVQYLTVRKLVLSLRLPAINAGHVVDGLIPVDTSGTAQPLGWSEQQHGAVVRRTRACIEM